MRLSANPGGLPHPHASTHTNLAAHRANGYCRHRDGQCSNINATTQRNAFYHANAAANSVGNAAAHHHTTTRGNQHSNRNNFHLISNQVNIKFNKILLVRQWPDSNRLLHLDNQEV